jgi:hypothetical protein
MPVSIATQQPRRFVHTIALSPTQGWTDVGSYEFATEQDARRFPYSHWRAADPDWLAAWVRMGSCVRFELSDVPHYDKYANEVV